MKPLHVRTFTATSCIGTGVAAILQSLLEQRSGLAGCGASSGYFGQPSQSYTINVIGTATGPGGATLQHLTTVTLTVQ